MLIGLSIVNIGKLIAMATRSDRERSAFGERMFKAREASKLTQKQVKAAIGISQSNLSDLEGPAESSGYTVQLAALYGADPHYLATGEPSHRATESAPDPTQLPHGAHAIKNVREVPVLGRGQGGLPERVWDDGGHPVGETGEYAEAATTDAQSFVIRVEGRSMEPRYMEGEYALVEPNTTPEIEDDVLVRLRNDGTMLKRLLSRRGGWRLGSYNDPTILNFTAEEVVWVYYVAHPVPARKIKQRT